MNPTIHRISTSIPEHCYEQETLRDTMKEIVAKNERDERVIHQIYARSGIKQRHSVLSDFSLTDERRLFFNGHGPSPGTGNRNDVYIRESKRLYLETGKKLLAGSFDAKDITHLITISCTGFYAPGPDYHLIRELGLSPAIERYHLGFMGCYAAIPGLKMARQICLSDPDANVMVISTELCTLHFQADNKSDDLISTSVFADGSAGVIMSNRKPEEGPSLIVNGFASSITSRGAEDMAWTIGDNGFDMTLSSYIPEILGEELHTFLAPVLDQFNLSLDQINKWAVHPGGRAILDKLESQLQLSKEIMEPSRNVLSRYGNMSSATILFVLKEIMESGKPLAGDKILAMAFGPGITIESALLSYHI
jgi:predicted naringenin-chalcone synthase